MLLAACGGGGKAATTDGHGHEHGPGGHSHDAAGTESHPHPHPHDVDGDHGHAHSGGHDHDHSAEEAGHVHAEEVVIGVARIGAWEASAHRLSALQPGVELEAGVDLSPADPQPTAVRIWVGVESGRGSMKAKADPERAHPGGWHAHVLVPDPLPAEAKYWVELETADGTFRHGYPLADGAGGQQERPLPQQQLHMHGGDHGHGHDHGDHSH